LKSFTYFLTKLLALGEPVSESDYFWVNFLCLSSKYVLCLPGQLLESDEAFTLLYNGVDDLSQSGELVDANSEFVGENEN